MDNKITDEDKISALRIRLEDCDAFPREIIKPFKPKSYVCTSWVPQTMGEQIWVLYKFKSVEDRVAWENSLPDNIKKWLDRNLIKWAVPYGWFIRNENGFVIQ